MRKNNISTKREERIGTRKQMNSGLWAVVHEYRRSTDIDVLFESDNAIAKNKAWKDFLNGKVAHPSVAPSYDREARVGEVKEMNNGLKAKIIAYRKSKDIDIQFVDDGAIVEHTQYQLFLAGRIAHPTKPTCHQTSLQEFAIGYYLNPMGFVKIEKGQWKSLGFGNYELDFYYEKTKVAIEYDGAIHNKVGGFEGDVEKNKRCKALGITIFRLRDSCLKELTDGGSINFTLPTQSRIGKELIFNCKKELESILNYCGCDFQEDYIDFERDLCDIMKRYKHAYIDKTEHKRIGERSYHQLTHQWMTLTAYHNCRNVDLKFDDGETRVGVTYSSFKAGNVLHPNLTRSDVVKMTLSENGLIAATKRLSAQHAKERIGEKYLLRNGRSIIITEYLSSENVTIKYLDNEETRANVAYYSLKKQSIKFLGKAEREK